MQYSGSDDVNTTDRRAKLIGTKSGRRTFINLCLDANVPINNIMGATGHLNVATLMIYADKRRSLKKNFVNVFGFSNPNPVQDYTLPLQIEARAS